VARLRRPEPAADAVDAAALRLRWRRLVGFSIPACDPPLPETHPLSLFYAELRRLGTPMPTGPLGRAVAAGEGLLDEFGLTDEFDRFDAALERCQARSGR
jgi:hypothetical protein